MNKVKLLSATAILVAALAAPGFAQDRGGGGAGAGAGMSGSGGGTAGGGAALSGGGSAGGGAAVSGGGSAGGRAAVSGGATRLVTGDQDLLVLDPFRTVAIVTPARFLSLHEGEREAT